MASDPTLTVEITGRWPREFLQDLRSCAIYWQREAAIQYARQEMFMSLRQPAAALKPQRCADIAHKFSAVWQQHLLAAEAEAIAVTAMPAPRTENESWAR